MRICTVGDPQDLASVYMTWLAQQQGVEVIALPEVDLGVEWSFGYREPSDGGGWLEVGGSRIPFDALAGLFVRFHPEPPVPQALGLEGAEERVFVMERRAALEYLLDSFPGTVVNRPRYGRANGSKPYQMALLRGAGLEVPRWIATNQADALERFCASCPDGAIYKSCSGLRSRVRSVDDALLAGLREGSPPVLAQEYVRGHDVRVHMVEGRAFPTEIVADTIDYRFDEGEKDYRPTEAPPEVVEACDRARRGEGLTLAGLDFRVTPDGTWYCLEMNPVPSFLPYEMQTQQPIGQAVLELMLETELETVVETQAVPVGGGRRGRA